MRICSRKTVKMSDSKQNRTSSAKERVPQPRPGKKERRFLKRNFRHAGDESDEVSFTKTPKMGQSDEQVEIQTTMDQVQQWMKSDKSYCPPAITTPLENLAKFDDFEKYGATQEQESRLREIEAQRIMDSLKDASTPILFQDFMNFFGPVNQQNYNYLSSLATQLLSAMSICSHDNQLLVFEHCSELFLSSEYSRSVSALKSRFDKDTKSDEGDSKNSDGTPKLLPHSNAELYCALLDYSTAVLARFAVYGVSDEYWHTRVAGGLARLSAKLKFLLADPKKYAKLSLEDGQDLLAKEEAFEYLGLSKKLHADVPIYDSPGTAALTSKERSNRVAELQGLIKQKDSISKLYFAEMLLVSNWAIDSLKSMLVSVRGSQLHGLSSSAFDICALTYKSGLNGPTILMFQDREGEILGSAQREFVRLSYMGFKLVHQAASAVSNRLTSAPPRTHPSNPDDSVTLNLELSEEQSGGRTRLRDVPLHLHSLVDVITVMVPMMCLQPITIRELHETLQIVGSMATLGRAMAHKSLPLKKFTAFGSLRSTAYVRETGPEWENDVRPLSKSLLAEQRLRILDHNRVYGTDNWNNLPGAAKDRVVSEANEQLKRLEQTVSTWVIEEKAVRVSCVRYVFWVMLACSILVVGGILTGALLGDRLTGVDPFDIATFAWVLAGFVILVCKSLLVAEWPWRDFLLGRVPCRSVSELHTVTGIDSQEILAYLLVQESSSILITKGPYNRPFTIRSEDGFAIDIKAEMRTLISSGIIAIKVTTAEGPALVCLDLRPGLPGRAGIQHLDSLEKDDVVIGCSERPEVFDEDQEVPLRSQRQLRWTRILGVYHKPHKKFR